MENFKHFNNEVKPQSMTLRYAVIHGWMDVINIYSNQYTVDTINTNPYCNINVHVTS